MKTNNLSTIKEYLLVLLKYKFWIIIPPAIVGVLFLSIGIQSKLFPKNAIYPAKYTSYAKVIMSIDINSQSSSLDEEVGNIVDYLGINLRGIDTISLAEVLIKSKLIIDTVIKNNDLINKYKVEKKSQCRKIFLDKLGFHVTQQNVYPFRKEPVVVIDYTDKDPELAKKIVDDLLVQLQKEFAELNKKVISQNIEFIEKRINEVTRRLIEIELEMIKIQNELDPEFIKREYSDNLMSNKFIKNQTLKREYETLEKLLEVLKTKYELNNMKFMNKPPIFIVEFPEVPEEKSNTSMLLITFAASALTFFISILLVFTYYAIFKKNDIKK